MQSTRRGTDRANTRLFSRSFSHDSLLRVRTKKRRVLQLEPLEERTLLSTYNIGPGQPYTTLGSFPWSSLGPGDTVDIHWQATPYYEKLLISESGTASAPINIVGVPGPNGQQPIIDGDNATTSSQFQYFYNPMQEDAVVLIGPNASEGRSYTPSYINISGLEIRNGYQAYNFTDNTGKTQTYGAFAASVWIEGASNITIQNCTLDSSGLGLFALTNDSNGMMTSNLMVEGNYFYNNGVPGSYGEHNSYCEVNGITYQYNYYGPLRAGSGGAELKDRSAGAVIRDNYFTPAATILDLVDAEDSDTLESLPSYTNTYVYGNIIDDTGPNYTSIPVEFGGDSGNTAGYRPNLYFYDNTVVTIANQSTAWRTNMFDLFTSGQTAYVANNIFYNAPATSGDNPSIFEFSGETGNITFSATNWVSPGWLTSESVELQQDYGGALNYSGTITGTNTFFVDPNNNPSFVNLSAGNYQLASGSNAIGIAGTIPSSWTTATGWPGLPTEEYIPPSTFFGGSGTARTSVADVGAYQAGQASAVTPTVTGETPASGATGVAVSTTASATFNEAVQSGTISFTLENSSGSSVAGSVSYNSTTNVTTFTPTSALASNTTYTATVSGAESTSGEAMAAPFSWSFTTSPGNTTTSPGNTATFVQYDTTTQGNWIGTYGSAGYNVIGDTPSYPSYATVTPSGQSSYTWASSTGQVSAPENPSASGRIAACWYSGSSFVIDVDLTDGAVHLISLYALDFDSQGRSEQFTVSAASTGTVLDTRTISNFSGGEYLTWNVSGNVQIKVTKVSGPNAVISGLFIGNAPAAATSSTATFVQYDTTTQGNWEGTYGSAGYNVIGDSPSYPSYATVTPSGQSSYTWASSTGQVSALENPSASGRIAACWYSASSFVIDVDLTDGAVHPISLYALDFDSQGRSEQFTVSDASTGTVLDTRTISNFSGGEYLTWNVSGNVQIKVTKVSGPNAVISGLFIGPQG